MVGEELIKATGASVQYKVMYACEKVACKQKWIDSVMHGRPGIDRACRPCVYCDICDMTTGAHCMVHDSRCDVPPVHMLVAGWSCKDLSRLSKDYVQKKNGNVLQEKRGSSGQTLDGLLRLLTDQPPPVYIGENVDEITDLQSENRQYLIAAFGDCGYYTDVIKVDSHEYGHWTKRCRAYIVAFHLEQCSLDEFAAQKLIKKIFDLIRRLKLKPEPYKNFVLANNDPYVIKDLERQMNVLETAKGQKVETSWQGNLLSLCHARGIKWNDCLLPEAKQTKFYCALGKRMQMALGYNLLVHPKASSVDICQSVERAFLGHDNVLTCLTPASRPFVVKMNRVLTGKECLMAQGFPKPFFEQVADKLDEAGISDSLMRDLAGNSFCSNSFMVVLLAVLVHWQPGACKLSINSEFSEEEDELDDVMHCLGL